MKKILAVAAIALIAVFGVSKMERGTIYNPLSKVEMQHLSYYGQYNSYK